VLKFDEQWVFVGAATCSPSSLFSTSNYTLFVSYNPHTCLTSHVRNSHIHTLHQGASFAFCSWWGHMLSFSSPHCQNIIRATLTEPINTPEPYFSGRFTGSGWKWRTTEAELTARPEKLSQGPEKFHTRPLLIQTEGRFTGPNMDFSPLLQRPPSVQPPPAADFSLVS
jgi:hypothetical protein